MSTLTTTNPALAAATKSSAAVASAAFTSQARGLGGFAFGIGTQAFFAFTVVGRFSFLRFGIIPRGQSWLLIDTVLALQFAIPHSILLHPMTPQNCERGCQASFMGPSSVFAHASACC